MIGFNNLADEILYHILKLGHFGHEKPLKITVVDEKYKNLNQKYGDWIERGKKPYLNDKNHVLWDLEFVSIENQFDSDLYLDFLSGEFKFDRVILCYKESNKSVDVLSYLNKSFYSKIKDNNTIIQLYNNHYALNRTVDNNISNFKNYYTFGDIETISDPDLIRKRSMITIAKITNDYKEYLPSKKWKMLDIFTRESNITEKQHMLTKLHYLDLNLINLKPSRESLPGKKRKIFDIFTKLYHLVLNLIGLEPSKEDKIEIVDNFYNNHKEIFFQIFKKDFNNKTSQNYDDLKNFISLPFVLKILDKDLQFTKDLLELKTLIDKKCLNSTSSTPETIEKAITKAIEEFKKFNTNKNMDKDLAEVFQELKKADTKKEVQREHLIALYDELVLYEVKFDNNSNNVLEELREFSDDTHSEYDEMISNQIIDLEQLDISKHILEEINENLTKDFKFKDTRRNHLKFYKTSKDKIDLIKDFKFKDMKFYKTSKDKIDLIKDFKFKDMKFYKTIEDIIEGEFTKKFIKICDVKKDKIILREGFVRDINGIIEKIAKDTNSIEKIKEKKITIRTHKENINHVIFLSSLVLFNNCKEIKELNEKIDILGKLEHTRWNVIHILNGWKRRLVKEKDLKAKEHFDLCDWETLKKEDDYVVKYDYKNIYQIPFVAYSLGKEIENK